MKRIDAMKVFVYVDEENLESAVHPQHGQVHLRIITRDLTAIHFSFSITHICEGIEKLKNGEEARFQAANDGNGEVIMLPESNKIITRGCECEDCEINLEHEFDGSLDDVGFDHIIKKLSEIKYVMDDMF